MTVREASPAQSACRKEARFDCGNRRRWRAAKQESTVSREGKSRAFCVALHFLLLPIGRETCKAGGGCLAHRQSPPIARPPIGITVTRRQHPLAPPYAGEHAGRHPECRRAFQTSSHQNSSPVFAAMDEEIPCSDNRRDRQSQVDSLDP